MTTPSDIIAAALVKAKVYAVGEQILDADMAQGLQSLNVMLDSWSNETLTVFANLTQTFTLVPGTQAYTIGPGGTWSGTRPLSIDQGPGVAFITDTSGNRYDVAVVPQDRWNQIGLISSNSDLPDTMFYDPQFPLGIINIFPIPLIGYQFTFTCLLPLLDLASPSTLINLPPGYQKAMEDNLAIELEPFFPTAELTRNLIEMAAKSKGNVKRTNTKWLQAIFDGEIVSRATPTYNIYRDAPGY